MLDFLFQKRSCRKWWDKYACSIALDDSKENLRCRGCLSLNKGWDSRVQIFPRWILSHLLLSHHFLTSQGRVPNQLWKDHTTNSKAVDLMYDCKCISHIQYFHSKLHISMDSNSQFKSLLISICSLIFHDAYHYSCFQTFDLLFPR